MLSDEEKKAIKEVKHFKELTRYWQEEEYEEKEIAGYIITVLNLIEKQSKEIEELKEKIKTFKIEDENIYLQFGEITEKKRWQDKIKAKIEELDDINSEFSQRVIKGKEVDTKEECNRFKSWRETKNGGEVKYIKEKA